MAIFSNILSCNSTKPKMSCFIKLPIIPQCSDTFKNAERLYNRRLILSGRASGFSPITALCFKPDRSVLALIKRPKPVTTILGSRFSYVHLNPVAASRLPSQIGHIEKKQSNQQVETLVDKVAKLNLQTIASAADISSMESVIEGIQKNEEVEAFANLTVPLEFAAIRLANLNIQPSSIPPSVTIPTNSSSLDEPTQSSIEGKLIRWILTSHNMYGLAVTVLHNFIDICCQKEGERNFINDSLVPRIRYTGFTFSATTSVVYHIAIGILFTPLVAATLGRKKEINEIWYGYWAGASISAMGMFAGMFGMVSGNYLIHKTIEKSISQFKRLLTCYLWHAQEICKRLNQVDFHQLIREVENVKTTAEMFSIAQKLIGIAKGLLPAMILQSRFSAL